MIYQINVTNDGDETLELELAAPEKSGVAVLSVSGLEPPEATINVMDLGANDGALYNSARLSTRNVVLNLMLMDNTVIDGKAVSIEELRYKIYRFFQIKRKVSLNVRTDKNIYMTEGYVEKCAPNIWSKMETVQVSLLCPDPYLYWGGGIVTTAFTLVTPAFSFGFANKSLTEPKLNMSYIDYNVYRDIYYEGDIEIGIRMFMRASGGPVTNIKVRDVDQRTSMNINTDKIAAITGKGFVDDDSIEIDTRTGKKKAILRRAGLEYNILNAIDRDSVWHKVHKGHNYFHCYCESGEDYLHFYIENPICYGGI